MSEINVELATRGYEAVVRGEFDAIGDILVPDVKWHGGDPTAVGACRGRDQVLEFMRLALGRGGVGELVEVIDRGDRVVCVLRVDGGLRANVTTFRDGKVVEMVAHESPEAALAAVGE